MIDRRTFLKGFLALSGCFLASAQLRPLPARAAVGDGAVRFAEGVASGDPMPDAITLWTRAKIPSEPNASQDLTLQLAAQPDFKETLVEHQVRALPETDHTMRVFVDGLKPDRIYYYRFLAARGGTSRIGRTRTAPAADSGRTVTIACTSCQNYEIGFYQGWRRMIVDDEAAAPDQQIDLVLQVGDFIYEGAGYHVPDVDFQRVHKGANALLDSNGNPRRVPPFPSGGVPGDYADKAAKTVEDFRLLYRTYLQDPNLQDARARWPFVCTWDDHEFADNSWQGHTNFGARQSGRLAANQAWFEYIPAALSNARAAAGIAPGAHDFKAADVQDNPFGGPGQPRPETEPGNQKAIASLAIYRTLSFGKHVNLLVTDVRSYRSGPPQPKWWLDKHLGGKAVPNAMGLVATLDAGREANDGKPPVTISVDGKVYPNPRFSEPPGTMLGRDQLHWLKGSLVSSDKTWKLCVSGVPMTGLTFDFDAVFWKSVPRVMLSADTWTGYPGERAELLRYIRDQGVKDAVVVSGDMHTHLAAGLQVDPTSTDEKPVCSEFAVAGMSSESLFRIVRQRYGKDKRVAGMFFGGTDQGTEVLNQTLLKGVLSSIAYDKTGLESLANLLATEAANPELRYLDSSANGYGIFRLSGQSLQAEWVTIAPPIADFGLKPAQVVRRAFLEQKRGELAPRLTGLRGKSVFGMRVSTNTKR